MQLHILDSNLSAGNFFSRYLIKNATELLPRKFKRLVYIGAVIGAVLREKQLDPEIADRINRKLRLASSGLSILLLIKTSCVMWKSIGSNIVELTDCRLPVCDLKNYHFCDMDYWKTGLFFARNTPPVLVYGSLELMTTDIRDALVELNRARHAA